MSTLSDCPALHQLLQEIDDEIHETACYTGVVALSPRVRVALSSVDRAHFILPEHQNEAWQNYPLPIGCNQTISQPYMVALMTELLGLTPRSRVLEIGTGSGYQTAILAQLCAEVFSVERIQELYCRAQERIQAHKRTDIHLKWGDGYSGWPEYAPFDGIIVTAAPETLPETFVEQLAEGGRLVIPLGQAYGGQRLYFGQKIDGKIQLEEKLAVTFVPMLANLQES